MKKKTKKSKEPAMSYDEALSRLKDLIPKEVKAKPRERGSPFFSSREVEEVIQSFLDASWVKSGKNTLERDGLSISVISRQVPMMTPKGRVKLRYTEIGPSKKHPQED